MGWKSQCILVSERGADYLSKSPEHRPERVESVARALGLGALKPEGRSTLVEALNPDAGRCALGVYDGGLFFADGRLIEGASADPENKLLRAVLVAYPTASVLVLELHGVSNYFGYALYEQGKLARGHMGVDGVGTAYEFGEPLPEERSLFDNSVVRDGQRLFSVEYEGDTEPVDASGVGEELAFGVSARLLGRPLPELDFEAEVEIFERVTKPIWKRLLGLA